MVNIYPDSGNTMFHRNIGTNLYTKFSKREYRSRFHYRLWPQNLIKDGATRYISVHKISQGLFECPDICRVFIPVIFI
jgi:hypothetical protein